MSEITKALIVLAIKIIEEASKERVSACSQKIYKRERSKHFQWLKMF